MSDHLLYLNAANLDDINVSPTDLRLVVQQAFASYASATTKIPPKQTLSLGPDHYFQTMAAVTHDHSFAGVKWVAVAGKNSSKGMANVNGLVVLSEFETGRPLAVIDGGRLTILRTAAMSALGAQYLAHGDSTSLGFVGCGAQAYGHVAPLREAVPSLSNVICYDRRTESARGLADYAGALGLSAKPADIVEQVLDCDVIVTTVPGGATSIPFLDANRLRPGALVIAVDLARPWISSTLNSFDSYFVDDRMQAEDPDNRAKLAYCGPFDGDLSELTSGGAQGRRDKSERILFVYPGFALADVVVAGELYKRARAGNIGYRLPR